MYGTISRGKKTCVISDMPLTPLQCFEFLHDNRIAHCDFIEQNTGMNVISDVNTWFMEGLRESETTEYTLFDFGHSVIYPLETNIRDVWETRYFRVPGEWPGPPRNPFQVDMFLVGRTMQRYLRVCCFLLAI